MDGFLSVLKPPGMTSHDVVSFARRLLKTKKIGHTGTLDPGVAGVIVLCVGKATRLVEYILDSGKAYRGEITLGKSTDTQDSFGQILKEKRDFFISTSQFAETIQEFQGKIKQIPPMYSAVKHQGKRLYQLARAGEVIEREAKEVEIKSFEIIGYNNLEGNNLTFDSQVLFDVECSKGTYIRTLCHDIGEKLGCGAYMSYLIRTAVSKFTLEQTWSLEELSKLTNPQDALCPITAKSLDLPQLVVTPKGQEKLAHGIALSARDIQSGFSLLVPNEVFVASNSSDELLAILKLKGNYWKPIKVLC